MKMVGSASTDVRCKNCDGTGSPGTSAGNRIVCGICGGSGRVLVTYAALLPLPEPEADGGSDGE